jgi:hypothetical protein
MYFEEIDRAMVMNPTNGQTMAEITKSDNPADSVGIKIELYNEPNVMFGTKKTGGIRIRPVNMLQTINPQKQVDELMAYNSLPKPNLAEQRYLKQICIATWGDSKCEIKNRLTIWNYINEKRWPKSVEEADSLSGQLKLAGDVTNTGDEIPF